MIDSHQLIMTVGRILHSNNIGYMPANASDPYPTTHALPPIFAKRLPAKPEECIALNVYGWELEPDPKNPLTVARLQTRVRAKHTADPLADRIVTALHGLHATTGDTIGRIRHVSTAQLGADPAGLDERTDNFHIILHTHS